MLRVKLQEAMEEALGICAEQPPKFTHGCEIAGIQPKRRGFIGQLGRLVNSKGYILVVGLKSIVGLP